MQQEAGERQPLAVCELQYLLVQHFLMHLWRWFSQEFPAQKHSIKKN